MPKLLVIANIMKELDDSLTYQLGKVAIKEYEDLGYETEVIDLYGENSMPEIDRKFVIDVLANKNDITKVPNGSKKMLEQKIEICEKVANADVVLFITGYWNSFYPIRLHNFLELLHYRGVTVEWTEGKEGSYHGLLKNKFIILQTQNWPNIGDGKDNANNFGLKFLERKMKFLGAKLESEFIFQGIANGVKIKEWEEEIITKIKGAKNGK